MKRLTNKIRHAAHQYGEYRRIMGEIASMSRREADDLGISAFDARRIAHEAVYGR